MCGAYGNKTVRTPNIDALAAAGMRFDQAFCNSPVCTASRQSFLTGRYPRTIGVTQLSTALPESETTLAELLAAVGYRTSAIGKMHFNSQLKHGFETHIDLPEFQKWLAAKGKTAVPAGIDVQPPWKPFRAPANIWLNAGALPYGARWMPRCRGCGWRGRRWSRLQRHVAESALPEVDPEDGKRRSRRQAVFDAPELLWSCIRRFIFRPSTEDGTRPDEFVAPPAARKTIGRSRPFSAISRQTKNKELPRRITRRSNSSTATWGACSTP